MPLWHQSSACADSDQRTFYGYNDRLPMTRAQVAAARIVCLDCPVRRDCLAEAIADDEEWGIWGGYTPLERARAIVAFDPAPKDMIDPARWTGHGRAAVLKVLRAFDRGTLDALVVRL